MHLETCTQYKLSTYRGLTRPAILRNKLSKYLGLARSAHRGIEAIQLEYKLCRYLGLAAPSSPGIQAISVPGLGGDQQSWNTGYLGTWVGQRAAYLEYKLSMPGLSGDPIIPEYKLSRYLDLATAH